jgi:fatty-acyl-CoA synthase
MNIMNGISFLRRNASKYPQKIGFVFENIPYTYKDAMATCLALANHLKKNGIGHNDKVCLLFYNSIEDLYAMFASLLIGAVAVPINFRFIGAEVSYIINNCDAKAVIYGEEFKGIMDEIRGDLPKVTFTMELTIAGEGAKTHLMPPIPEEIQAINHTKIDPSDDAVILYTSGTTGTPKGAVLTHYNMLWNQARIINSPDVYHDEVMINPLPFFHSGGLGRVLTMMLVGGTIMSWKKFDAQELIENIPKYKATFMLLVPAMARMILGLPDRAKYDLSSVRNIVLTAAIVPVPLKKQVLELFSNAQILDGYGITENSSAVTCSGGKDVFERPSSVGLPDFFTEVKIVNDDFVELPANEVGEIAVFGPNVMKGYYNDPVATANTIRDGWLLTGDLGKKDDDGYLYIVGRRKDMIISGGENVYPAEIEAILDKHPAILESAVIGVPDPKWGETVMAFLVLKPGERLAAAEVDEYCKARMAGYKRPRKIKFLDELVKNASGKTLKYELKRLYGTN